MSVGARPSRPSVAGGTPALRQCLAAALLLLVPQPAYAADFSAMLRGLRWGESQQALLKRLGGAATVLARPIDFGDSYTQIVVRDVTLGDVPVIAFFQIDKRTGGLKRIQFERQRHGANLPAFRAIVGGLDAAYGRPAAACTMRAAPADGYQAWTEFDWSRGGDLVRAVFRDTTIEAVEGCLGGDITTGHCGLTGQLIVRLSPPGADAAGCRLGR